MSLIEEVTAELAKKYDQVKKRYFIYIPLFFLALLLAFYAPWVSAIALFLGLLYQLFYVRGKSREFSQLFNHYHILIGLEKLLSGLQHTMKEGIGQQDILDCRMIPSAPGQANWLLGREHTTGTAGDLPVELCDATFCYQHKSGHVNRGYCVSGCWTRIELPCDTGCDWRFMEKNVLDEMTRREYFSSCQDLEKAELGVDWFDERYYFYRPKGSTEKPDAALLRQIKLLQEYTPGRLCLSVHGRLFQAFIADRVLAVNVSPTRVIDPKDLLTSPFPELENLIRMARLTARQEQDDQ